jgi:Skp family chaperone for outer membrane proteins
MINFIKRRKPMIITNVKKIVAAAMFASAITLSTVATAAEDKTRLPIAVVDVQVLLEKATAVTKVRNQIDEKAESFKKEFGKKEEYFKKKYEDLDKQKSVLSQEAYNKKSEELQKELGEAQKKVQDNRNALDKAHNDAMQKIEATFTDIVKEEAKTNGYKVVMHKAQTIYSDEALDITTKVIDALNKKLPSVDVKF